MRIATLLACLLGTPPLLARTLPNGTFDSDLSGWDLQAFPDTVIAWDPFGNPAGSMRVESSWDVPPTANGVFATTSDCFDLLPGDYAVAVDFYAEIPSNNGDQCSLSIARYVGFGCPGSPSGSSDTSSVSGIWLEQQVSFQVFDGVPNSWRFVLGMIKAPGQQTSVCHFDNLRLVGPPPSALEIPTLNQLGLGALTLVLAAIALVVLKRCSR